jgi:hypothetical protein
MKYEYSISTTIHNSSLCEVYDKIRTTTTATTPPFCGLSSFLAGWLAGWLAVLDS